MVLVNDDGTEMIVIDEDGFSASLVDGVWYEGILYDFHEQKEFYQHDPKENSSTISAARKALAVNSPTPPGEAFAQLIEPLNRLHRSLKVANLEPNLETFRLETIKEWARLSLRRYALRSSWIILLSESLTTKALSPYPDALATARAIAKTIHLTSPDDGEHPIE